LISREKNEQEITEETEIDFGADCMLSTRKWPESQFVVVVISLPLITFLGFAGRLLDLPVDYSHGRLLASAAGLESSGSLLNCTTEEASKRRTSARSLFALFPPVQLPYGHVFS
jgi:hypothetical protein